MSSYCPYGVDIRRPTQVRDGGGWLEEKNLTRRSGGLKPPGKGFGHPSNHFGDGELDKDFFEKVEALDYN